MRRAPQAPRLDHHALERYERIWLGVAVVMTVLLFVGVLSSLISGTYPRLSGQGGGHSMAVTKGRVDPANLAATPFARPGLVVDAAGQPVVNAQGTLDAYIVAGNFTFQPAVLRLPAGRPVTLHVTATDVAHGFQITGTNVNVELLPGHVATLTVTFRRSGEQHVICNEYCGLGHHNMITRFLVEPPAPAAKE
ncbi:cytochrome C oxidase subunit II [Deinococcus arcticus]|uniref:Cytochrome C oxidase subunit II n=1 Tax=Deinococcus arcticus TaxID=2136176 RepID=A0A2T3W998_9DEIO|nr:cytochrome C oxidase subunit II [Deinococcus arcticus]PTA68397.1 cytochrome C oxidase subunit II [Deinococcus arcticus]